MSTGTVVARCRTASEWSSSWDVVRSWYVQVVRDGEEEGVVAVGDDEENSDGCVRKRT